MNSLSWLLYLSNVVPNIGGVLIVIAVGCGVATLYVVVVGWMEDSPEIIAKWRVLLPLCLGAAIVAALIPTQQTILTIAASELGERVATTQDGQEILTDLKDAVKAQLKALKEPRK